MNSNLNAAVDLLVVLVIAFGAIVLIASVFLGRALKAYRKENQALEKRIVALTKRVELQEAQSQRIMAKISSLEADYSRHDPVLDIVETLLGWASNGPVRTLVGVGTKLFKSYSRQKKLKALPSKTTEE